MLELSVKGRIGFPAQDSGPTAILDDCACGIIVARGRSSMRMRRGFSGIATHPDGAEVGYGNTATLDAAKGDPVSRQPTDS